MFREMRRCLQALPAEECQRILENASSGVLALSGDDGYPYAVPLSFLYRKGKLYFHCAREGHKIDAIRRCEKASFCILDQDQVVPEQRTTWYRSLILFGRVRILEDDAERLEAIEKFNYKYSPIDEEGARQEIKETWPRLCLLEMEIEHISGKESRALAQQREGK